MEEARILKLLEEGKVTREEAELLLEALSEGKAQPEAEAAPESVEAMVLGEGEAELTVEVGMGSLEVSDG